MQRSVWNAEEKNCIKYGTAGSFLSIPYQMSEKINMMTYPVSWLAYVLNIMCSLSKVQPSDQ